MLNAYPGKKLRNLRRRANLTQMQVVNLTGVSETTIHYLEHDLRKPQTATLEKLLNLYAIRITRLEKMERIWGDDGLQRAGSELSEEQKCKVKSQSQSPSAGQNVSKPASMRSERLWPRMTAS
jgi:transcriptional regulator with XRE-family HTH domain